MSETPEEPKKMSIDDIEVAIFDFLFKEVDENGLDWTTTVEELHSNLSSNASAHLSRGRLDICLARLKKNDVIHTSIDDTAPFTEHLHLDGDYFANRAYHEDNNI